MHNGKSLMQSEITLEQSSFTAFFASSELFSCLSPSVAEAKVSQGKSLICQRTKTTGSTASPTPLTQGRRTRARQSRLRERAAGKPRQFVAAPEGAQVCSRNGRSVKQLRAGRSVPGVTELNWRDGATSYPHFKANKVPVQTAQWGH